jgi:hypothetical protein
MYDDPNKMADDRIPERMTHGFGTHKARAVWVRSGRDDGEVQQAINGRPWFNGYTHEMTPCPDGCRHGYTKWPVEVDLSDGVYCDTCNGNGFINPNKFYAGAKR